MSMTNTERFTRKGKKLTEKEDRHFLGNETGAWGIHQSDLTHYMKDLWRLERYPDEIKQTVLGLQNPVVVDLMSSTRMLLDLFTSQPFQKDGKFIAVSHYDTRDTSEKFLDDVYGISLVTGNIRKPETWSNLRNELNGLEADIVVSRALAGLHFLPIKGTLGYKLINNAYGILKDYGSMYLQIPPASALVELGVPMDTWLAEVESSHLPYIYVPEYESPTDRNRSYGLLRIDRIPGASELPGFNSGISLLNQAA